MSSTANVAKDQQERATQRIPINPNCIIGTLPNGLTYYIQPNTKPENRIVLRMAVKVGSMHEDDSEQGESQRGAVGR